MSNPKRRHRGNDRTQAFLRKQQEQRDLDFAAIEARYRKELITLKDGSTVSVTSDTPKAPPAPKAPARLPSPKSRDPDDLLELALAYQPVLVEGQRELHLGEQEAKQALRDRGVSFAREPKSIHSPVAQGRIGSIPRAKAPTKKPDGNGGKVALWPGNTERRLKPYIHRFYGQGDL